MKTINPYFLHVLIRPLAGLADDVAVVQRYASLNPNDEQQIKSVIRELLVPNFAQLTAEMQAKARLALQFYLSKPGSDFKRVYESCLPPFDSPQDSRLFFLWLWEELFPNVAFEIGPLEDFREVADIDEPNRLAARSNLTRQP